MRKIILYSKVYSLGFLKLLLLTLLFFHSIQGKSQQALSFNLGYTTCNVELLTKADYSISTAQDRLGLKGLSYNLHYRWYKYDRGFRTLSLNYFSKSIDLPVSVYNANTDMYDQKIAPYSYSYTLLHYDAAFAIFGSEIEDRLMPYFGGGYYLGLFSYKIDVDGIDEYLTMGTDMFAGLDIKLGMDFNLSRKLALNTEIRAMTSLNIMNGLNFQAGLLYKFY